MNARLTEFRWIRGPLAIAALAAALGATWLQPTTATSFDFDAMTIADLNRAFDRGALTAERLVQLCLARIEAYDRKGPSLHAVITLNPKALDTARALDAERKSKGARSPLHGI
ncbi:MAG TPA: hypothetical protein VKD69_21995, partial [Vicinamibacterales bacterium]|nr:hypothetical protein [Vicinamibacterales bacterium]